MYLFGVPTTGISRARKVGTAMSPVLAPPATLRVGLLGLGTVGQGLCELLERARGRLPIPFEVARALVRDPARPRRFRPPLVTADAAAFLAGDYDVVVEALGGVEPAGALVAAFLERGVPVVTANKALLAERGEALQALATRHGAALRFEASLAAGLPILALLERSLQSTAVTEVTAVLNATSNLVLTRVAEGIAFSDAVEEAQRLGWAESDPRLDLSGEDAAQKLRILAWQLTGRAPPRDAFEVEGLGGVRREDTAFPGWRLKPVAHAVFAGDQARGFVGPALVPEGHPLAGLTGGDNGVLLRGDPIPALFLSGPGAGALPTATALLDDLLAVARGGPSRSRVRAPTARAPELRTRWLLAAPGAWQGITEPLPSPAARAIAARLGQSFPSSEVRAFRIV
jgi:homoserine dehydrogenase